MYGRAYALTRGNGNASLTFLLVLGVPGSGNCLLLRVLSSLF